MRKQIEQNHSDLELEPLFKMIKKVLFIFLIFKFLTMPTVAQIVYLDINFVINNSEIGKSLNEKIKEINEKNNLKFRELEKIIIDKEQDLIAKKNIIDQSEFQKMANILSKEIQKFKADKKTSIQKINEIKLKNTNTILQILNPIISNYVKENSINLVISKQNIILGKKNLDITEKIVEKLNNEKKQLSFK